MARGQVEMSGEELEALAWKFLGSEFAGTTYTDWHIDRRVEAYLRHQGMGDIANDGGAYTTLLERILANMGAAMRRGLLAPPSG